MDKAVIVAGGAGYIGSHVCKALQQAGYLPVVLDDFSAGRRDFVRWGPVYQACVSNQAMVREICAAHSPKAVIDLAGSIEVGESVRDPLKYYQNNAAVKTPFLLALHEAGVEAFVFSSTAAVYGEPESVPIPEAHRLQPKNPYGWSKLVFEQMLRDFHGAGGPGWTALRYFNAAGASPDGDIGESHDPETHLIPRACLAALGRLPPLDIFGNDFATRDGTCERDYVHVSDLADAHVLAVDRLLNGAEPDAYNLGNGKGTTIGQMLACFATLGIDVPHNFGPRRAGDPARLVADTTKARQVLGWQPKYNTIETIVGSAFAWHQAQHSA